MQITALSDWLKTKQTCRVLNSSKWMSAHTKINDLFIRPIQSRVNIIKLAKSAEKNEWGAAEKAIYYFCYIKLRLKPNGAQTRIKWKFQQIKFAYIEKWSNCTFFPTI